MAAEHRQQRPLRDQDEDHEHRRPEGRQAGRQLLDHQAPDQHHYRQQVVQTALQRRPRFRQLEDLRVGVVELELRLARAVPDQCEVGGQQQHGDDAERGAGEDVLDPADAVVHDARQHDESGNRHDERQQPLRQGALAASRQALQVGLQRLEVDDVEQRDVRDHRRQEGVLDHLRVRDADILDHQEGGGTHHRRHDLPVDRAGDLDRPGLVAAVADALHQRDGEGAGGHHVGDRRAGDDPGRRRRDDRRLGRPAAHVAEQRKRRLDEVVAGAGLVEQRAEQHEQEDEAGRHAQRDAEHALGGQPVVRRGLGQRRPAVRDHLRHERAEEGVAEEDAGDDHHRQAERPPRGLQQQQHAGDGDIDVHVGRLPGPRRQLRVEQVQVGGAEGAGDGEDPVLRGHVGAGRALEGRIGGEGQEHGESKVDRPRLCVVEHEHAERERQRAGVPQLEQRPRQRHQHQKQRDGAGRMAAAGVGLGDHLLQLVAPDALALVAATHCDAPPCPALAAVMAAPLCRGRRQRQTGRVCARPAFVRMSVTVIRRPDHIQPFSL